MGTIPRELQQSKSPILSELPTLLAMQQHQNSCSCVQGRQLDCWRSPQAKGKPLWGYLGLPQQNWWHRYMQFCVGRLGPGRMGSGHNLCHCPCPHFMPGLPTPVSMPPSISLFRPFPPSPAPDAVLQLIHQLPEPL